MLRQDFSSCFHFSLEHYSDDSYNTFATIYDHMKTRLNPDYMYSLQNAHGMYKFIIENACFFSSDLKILVRELSDKMFDDFGSDYNVL